MPVLSWFDDPTDRALLDLIPFFEGLDKADDVYVYLGNDNLPSSTTMYIGAVTLGTTPPITTMPEVPIFSPPVPNTADQTSNQTNGQTPCDHDGS